MEYLRLLRERYACRDFKPERLPDEKVKELLEAIRLTPSALNLQPWRIKVVEEEGLKRKLFEYSMGQGQVLSCSHLLVFCANTDIEQVISSAERAMLEAGFPEEKVKEMVAIARTIKDKLTREWAREQVFMALCNAVIAAKALGFDSCPMTGFDPEGYREVLGLPPNLEPVALCAIGYGKGASLPKARLKLEEILL